MFIYPATHTIGGLQGQVGITAVVLDPGQQAAGGQNRAGLALYLAVKHGRLERLLSIVELTLAEVIDAEPVIRHGFQGYLNLVDVFRYQAGEVRSILFVISAAGQVWTYQ